MAYNYDAAISGAAHTIGQADLAALLREAQKYHHDFEERNGTADANWPEWYASYILARMNGMSERR